ERQDQRLRGEVDRRESGAGGRSESAGHGGAGAEVGSERGSGRRADDPESDGRDSGADCGATGEASYLSESTRGGTRHRLQRIHRARERGGECDREAARGSRRDSRYRQGRSTHGTQRAVATGIVRGGRADSGRDRARGESGERTRRDRFALRSGISPASVPDRSTGNL